MTLCSTSMVNADCVQCILDALCPESVMFGLLMKDRLSVTR